jgi:hypothetical protein
MRFARFVKGPAVIFLERTTNDDFPGFLSLAALSVVLVSAERSLLWRRFG